MTQHQIMIIDDNAADVKLLTRFFKPKQGISQFTVAVDGEEALKFVYALENYSDRKIPDIILLDLNLPKKGGTEILVEIRNHPEMKTVPVLVISGSDNPHDKADCLALGANRFVTKPSDLTALDGLFKIINEHLPDKANTSK